VGSGWEWAEARTGISRAQLIWIARTIGSVVRRRLCKSGHVNICISLDWQLIVMMTMMMTMIMLARFLPLQIVLCHQLMHPPRLLFRGQSELLDLLQLLAEHRHAIVLR
jgi:hypothetical protein